MALKILLVDDHEVVRMGLKSLLSHNAQFQVVAEAGSSSQALEQVTRYSPDVVVMDIRLPGKSGIEATREITAKFPKTKVIVLTSYAEDELLFDAIAAGASGYVLKQIGSGELVRALETIGRGESLIDPALTQKVFARVREASRKAEDEAFATLSDQELKILALVSKGKTNKEIAGQLFISHRTVETHRSKICEKLELQGAHKLLQFAIEHRSDL